MSYIEELAAEACNTHNFEAQRALESLFTYFNMATTSAQIILDHLPEACSLGLISEDQSNSIIQFMSNPAYT